MTLMDINMAYVLGSTSATAKTLRIFDPSENLRGTGRTTLNDPYEIITYDTLAGISRLKTYTSGPQFSGFVVDDGSIVIALDRASGKDGNGDPRTTYSLLFGPNSPLNVAQHTAIHYRWGVVQQTNQAAELYAFYEAMVYSLRLEESGFKARKVVIMTRSSYLTKGLAEHIYRWEKNGWRDNKNRIIKNKAAFEYIHSDLEAVRKYCDIDITIWLVDKKHNAAADSLAKGALECPTRRDDDLLRLRAIRRPMSPNEEPPHVAALNVALASLPPVAFQTTMPHPTQLLNTQTEPLATFTAQLFDNANLLAQSSAIAQVPSLDLSWSAAHSHTADHHTSQGMDHPLNTLISGPVVPKKPTSNGIDAILEQMAQPLDLTTPCFHFWVHKAPHYTPALELAKRLKINLASKKSAKHYMIQVMYAVRRLVVTGEDRAENFELLFGPCWREGRADHDINLLWLEARLEVLCCPRPGCITHIMSERYDETTPRWTPRGPSPDEEKMIRAIWSGDEPNVTTAKALAEFYHIS